MCRSSGSVRVKRASYRFASSLALIALVGNVGPATVGEAQVTSETGPTLSSLRVGDTIRVWAIRPPLSGAVALITRAERDTLALENVPGRRVFRSGVTVPVPFQTLTRLEVQRGYRRSVGWGVAGTVLGLAGGFVLGAVAGVAVECGSSCGDEGDIGGIAGVILGGGLGAFAGAITGGLVGARRRPRWQPVALPLR